MAVNGTITTAGAAYLSQRISAMATVTIDHFVMANVPGIDENTEADQDFVLAEGFIVDTAPVYRLSHNGENSVVYSMVLDGDVGNFDFNWYGLVTDTGVILAFAHIPKVAKRSNVGQIVNRNFIVPFTAAKALTGADIPAESWQFDFTESIADVTVSLLGPRHVYSGDSYIYQFTDWDDFSTYSVEASIGIAVLGNAVLTLDIPAETPAGECLLTIIRNGSTRVVPIRVGDPIVASPMPVSPVDGDNTIRWAPTLTVSPFKTFPANLDQHVATDWELINALGQLVFSSYDDTDNVSEIRLPAGLLNYDGYEYKWRARMKGAELGVSEWSEFVRFITDDELTPGAPIAGGYYVGMMEPSGDRYALIVSPKAQGEALLTVMDDNPALMDVEFNTSYWNGVHCTRTINNVNHDGAHFISNLIIAGYEDWYVPARNELELLYRNLKPSTGLNHVEPRYGDGIPNGRNPDSDPFGVEYTATYPKQTTSVLFREGGSEQLEKAAYSASSRYPGTDVYHWQSMRDGRQMGTIGRGSLKYFRAVRRMRL